MTDYNSDDEGHRLLKESVASLKSVLRVISPETRERFWWELQEYISAEFGWWKGYKWGLGADETADDWIKARLKEGKFADENETEYFCREVSSGVNESVKEYMEWFFDDGEWAANLEREAEWFKKQSKLPDTLAEIEGEPGEWNVEKVLRGLK